MAFIPLFIVGIVLLIMAYSNKEDVERKNKLKKWGWRAIYVPILVIIIGLLGSIVLGVVINLK